MTARDIVFEGLKVLTIGICLSAILHALGWIAETDRQVERASAAAYCEGVAIWQAEAARGVPELQRTGHPDYQGTAADHCPGLRPAGPEESQNDQRQLAHH